MTPPAPATKPPAVDPDKPLTRAELDAILAERDKATAGGPGGEPKADPKAEPTGKPEGDGGEGDKEMSPRETVAHWRDLALGALKLIPEKPAEAAAAAAAPAQPEPEQEPIQRGFLHKLFQWGE